MSNDMLLSIHLSQISHQRVASFFKFQHVYNIVWVISTIRVVNQANSKKCLSICPKPLKTAQVTITLTEQSLNFADLLTLWQNFVNPFPTFQFTLAVSELTTSSIKRYKLISIIPSFILTHTA